MVTLQEISAVGAVLSVLFILLTYLWSEMPSHFQVEEQLRGRFKGIGLMKDGVDVRFQSFRAHKSRSVKDRVLSRLLLRPIGYVEVEIAIESENIEDGEYWDSEAFERIVDDIGIKADYEKIGIEGGKQHMRVTVRTLNQEDLHNFLRGLEDVAR